MKKITQSKNKNFINRLKNAPDYVQEIPSIKKFLKNPSKNPRKTTIDKLKNEIRKEQYRISKTTLQDTLDIRKKVRNFSFETFDNYLRSREILQPKESIFISQKYKSENQASYLFLRDNGVSRMQAKEEIDKLESLTTAKEKIKHLEKINRLGTKTYEIARKLAKGNNVELENILRGMRLSDKTEDDWEKYVKMRQGQKWIPVRLDIKTGKYVKLNGEQKAELHERYKDGYYEN